MEQQKELERIEKMIDEAQTSLTNCNSTNDRKNEAQVLKELYAARKGIIDSMIQEEMNKKEVELKKNKDYDESCNEYRRVNLEERRLIFEQECQDFEKKMRKYDTIIKVGTTAAGIAVCFGCWGVAAVTANDGVYDASIIRSMGMIPQKFVEGMIRR